MVMIDVDFEVFKALTVRRRSEAMTENDVIRELLALKTVSRNEDRAAPPSSGTSWVSKGVSFPHGTEFRATYKGQEFKGIVNNGALVLNGKRFTAPSAAAVSITGNPVNGWRFWECRLPDGARWQLIAELRG